MNFRFLPFTTFPFTVTSLPALYARMVSTALSTSSLLSLLRSHGGR